MGRLDTNALFIVLSLTLTACSVTRSVRPVGRHQIGTAISVGGPLFVNLGPPLPIPISVASVRFGVTDKTDVDVGLLLPIVPTLGLDVGGSTLVLQERRWLPALMAGLRGTWIAPLPALAASHFLVEGHGTASWTLSSRVLCYLGLDMLMDLNSHRWHPSTLVGARYNLPIGGLNISAEGRFLAMATRSEDLSVVYSNLAGYGALGVVVALGYTFPARKGHHAL